MNKEIKKQSKKKEREKKSKDKVIKLREISRAKTREERKKYLEEKQKRKEARKLDKHLQNTVENLSEDTLEKINHNLDILKALEEEYIQEELKRKELHEELEKEGYLTMEDKVKRLQEILSEKMEVAAQKAEEITKSGAVCSFSSNE